MKKNYLLLVLCMHSSFASLDSTFNFGNGYIQTSINGNVNEINKIKMQPLDDKIITVGYATINNNPVFAIARYNNDGSLDTTSFNAAGIEPGIATSAINDHSQAHALDIQADGNIVIAGYTFDGTNGLFAIARYSSNGTLDTTFNNDGIVTTLIGQTASIAKAIQIQSDGKLVVGGSAIFGVPYFALARYNTDGSLDTTFNASGSQPGTITTLIGNSSQANALAIQSDGKIILAGNSDGQFALARYTSNGSLDTTFNPAGANGGTVITPIGNSSEIKAIAIQNNGKIIVAGYSDNHIALARYNSNGTLDNSYGNGGTIITPIGISSFAYDLVLQDDNKAVICGSKSNEIYTHLFLARYNVNGSLDTTFGSGGLITTTINEYSTAYGLAIDANKNFVIGGNTTSSSPTTDFLVARFKEHTDLIRISSPTHSSTTFNQNIAINGTYQGSNNTIHIYIDNVFSSTVIGANGIWNAGNSPTLAEGFHTIQAHLLDTNNAVVDSYQIGFTIDFSHMGLMGPTGATGASGTDVGAGNYIFAYRTLAQTLNIANTYQNILFSNNATEMNGWTHAPGTAEFTATVAGVYLIDFSAQINSTAPQNPFSIRATLNNVAIAASQAASSNAAGVITRISNSVLITVGIGDTLRIQIASGLTGNNSGIAPQGLLPTSSATIIITRLA